MSIAYIRKSNKDVEKTVAGLKKAAEKFNFKILGEVELPAVNGKTISICKTQWMERILNEESQLMGFLPCTVAVFEKEGNILIGASKPSVIKDITHGHNENLNQLATEAEKAIKELIHTAAGVGDLKPKSVTLYATMSCPYCTMEESWLKSKNIEHEKIFVDLNPQKAEELVQKTGQMGVPVTEIEYEDAGSEFIVGFNKPQLSEILGVEE